jgi:hypothetical protein
MAGDLNRGEHFERLEEDGIIMLEHILEYKCEGTDRRENVSSIIACSLAAGETCPKSCSLLYCSQFTQLLLGNGSTCHSILILHFIFEPHLNLH